MCRLFAMSGGREPVHATFWLLEAPDSLSDQSHREADGTGLGYYDADGRPVVSKQALAAFKDRDFAREAKEVVSRTFVAHVRYASTGGLSERNTHPFEQDGRLFAHNGVVEGLDRLEAELGDDMSLVSGDTDSERLFALVTRETRRTGDVGEGITAAEYIDLINARRSLIARAAARLAPYDALVMPTTANTPPVIADLADDKAFTVQNLRALRNCTLINMIDGCAISLPAHRDGEVPVGLMLASTGGADRRIFELAAGMEAAIRV